MLFSVDLWSLMCSSFFFFLMIRRPPRSTLSSSSAASDVYKRQPYYTPLFFHYIYALSIEHTHIKGARFTAVCCSGRNVPNSSEEKHICLLSLHKPTRRRHPNVSNQINKSHY
eukprot:TRINITY_DN5791_c0_g1_i3.p1 TRINITY_DN5791_c0_g1~~TRINITY_DN5791_c0_g1_i3.p1  ORF type:complete len:113 (+),score=10.42 TRINITY_DN5791_c0_g1_i3:66-404(+)